MRPYGLRRCLLSALAVVGLALAPLAIGVLAAGPVGASPNGFTLLVTGEGVSCQLAGIDLGSGNVTPRPHNSVDACAADIAETPDGRVFGLQQVGTGPTPTVHLLQYDTTTGVPTDLGQVGTFAAVAPFSVIGGITFDSKGDLFVEMVGFGDPNCGGQSVCLYRVNTAVPSSATFIGQGPFQTDLEFLTAACDGRAVTLQEPVGAGSTGSSWPPQSGRQNNRGPGGLHGLDVSPNELLVSRSLASGAVTSIGNVGTSNIVSGLAFDSSGRLWGVGGINGSLSSNVFTLDPSTGVATPGVTLTGLGSRFPITLALP